MRDADANACPMQSRHPAARGGDPLQGYIRACQGDCCKQGAAINYELLHQFLRGIRGTDDRGPSAESLTVACSAQMPGLLESSQSDMS